MRRFADRLGDIHGAVFSSQPTGLVRIAVITMSMEGEGGNAEIELSYRLKSTNGAVAGL